MSYCCRKRKHCGKMTNHGVVCESHETQIGTDSVRNDLGLSHLPWQRDHLDDLSRIIFYDFIATEMGTVLCWGRKVLNSHDMLFEIFFIIQFHDPTSLYLKGKKPTIFN